MATFQAPQIITLTLDKQKIFDFLKNLAHEPEKFTMDVDELLKAAAVARTAEVPDEDMEDEEAKSVEKDLEEKVFCRLVLI